MYVADMARTNMDGKSIKMVLRWLLNREDLQDAEIAAALATPASSYSRHKDDDDFPSFEELEKIGRHFGINPIVLQVAFGLRDIGELVLLDEDGMRLYMEQGGGNHLDHPLLVGARREKEHRRGSTKCLETSPAMIGGLRKIHHVKAARNAIANPPWKEKPSA